MSCNVGVREYDFTPSRSAVIFLGLLVHQTIEEIHRIVLDGNIQQLYESRDKTWTPQNAVDALLGPDPSSDLSAHAPSMVERVKELRDVVVLNDEAHHVHDEDLAWSQSLLGVHRYLPAGLALWL